MRVLDPFFLQIKSWCGSTLHKIDFRCPTCHKTFLHFKSNWNLKVVGS